MLSCTFVVKVWHEDSEGRSTRADLFDSLSSACAYAVAKKGKIAYGLPTVAKHYFYYDAKKETVSEEYEVLKEADILAIAEKECKIRKWGK